MARSANSSDASGFASLRRLQSAFAGAAIAGLAAAFTFLPALDRLHGFDIDALHWLRATIAPKPLAPSESPTVVVAIDESTHAAEVFAGLPKVMWTPQIATVQDAVMNAGAKVFGWDVVFPTSAGTYVADRRYDQPLLISFLNHGRREGRIVLGRVTFADRLLQPHEGFRTAIGRNPNIRELRAYVDEDGVVRGVPLMLPQQDPQSGEVVETPGMALELAARALGVEARRDESGRVFLGDSPIAQTEDGALTVNFPDNAGAIPTFALADLLACAEAGRTDYFDAHFKDRVVLLGLIADLEDRKVMSNRLIAHPDFAGAPEPCSEGYRYFAATARSTWPGVYLHATAVNNLLRGDALVRPGPGLRLGSVLAVALLVTTVALAMRPQRSAPVALAVGAAWVLLATFVFRQDIILPLIDPLIAGILALGASIGYRYVTTDRERARIRDSFAHYLDPAVIDSMLEEGKMPELGGEERELTVFFSDIEKFSAISERMGPAELVEFLNEYFAIMGVEIERHGGFIERFIGDAVIAVFGAPVDDPDHALHAVQAAIAIQERLTASADRFDVPDGMAVRTRFGVNTGVMTVGNVGSNRRFAYTVMGDSVNLSARLESVNKQFGTYMLAGDRTWELCKDAFEWRAIDVVRVVGRERPVTLREPLGVKGEVDPAVLDRRDRFEDGLRKRMEKDFVSAKAIFDALAAEGDRAAAIAASNMQRLIDDPPPPEWDGVTDLRSK